MPRRPTWLAFVGAALFAIAAISVATETTVVRPGLAAFIATGIAVSSSTRTSLRAVLTAFAVLAGYALLLSVLVLGLPWWLLTPAGSSDPSGEVIVALSWQDNVILAAALALPLWALAGRAARRADLQTRRRAATTVALVPVVVCIVGSASSSVAAVALWLASVAWLAVVLAGARGRPAPAAARPVVE